MKKNKLLFYMLFCLLIGVCAFSAASYADEGEASQAISQEEQKKKEAQERAAYAAEQIALLEKEMDRIQQEARELVDQNLDLNRQIEDVRARIRLSLEECEKAQEELGKQRESMALRIQFNYEQEQSTFLDVLTGARSLSEVLNHAEYIRSLGEYDRKLLDWYALSWEEEERSRKDLLKEEDHLITLLGETEDKQKEYQTKIDEMLLRIRDYESQMTGYEQEAAAHQAEIDQMKIQFEAAKAAAEKAAVEAARLKAEEEKAREMALANQAAEEMARREAEEARQLEEAEARREEELKEEAARLEEEAARASSEAAQALQLEEEWQRSQEEARKAEEQASEAARLASEAAAEADALKAEQASLEAARASEEQAARESEEQALRESEEQAAREAAEAAAREASLAQEAAEQAEKEAREAQEAADQKEEEIKDSLKVSDSLSIAFAIQDALKRSDELAVQAAAAMSLASNQRGSGSLDIDPYAINASGYSNLRLLAAIIDCEAGPQGYEGLRAVGNVILSRIKHPAFQTNLYDVIYAPNQFTPAYTGLLEVILAMGPRQSCYDAALDCLEGVRVIPEQYLYFCSIASWPAYHIACPDPIQIESHMFYYYP